MSESAEKEKQYRSFKDLLLWQQSLGLVDFIYSQTLSLPEESKVLTEQLQQASVSIPQFFAIGFELRFYDQESYIRRLRLMLSEMARIETLWYILIEIGVLDDQSEQTTSELSLQLTNLRKLTFGVLKKQFDRRKSESAN